MNNIIDSTSILVTQRILLLRKQKVIIDADLAALYGVETRRLNEQVKRNPDRFPEDFMFRLTAEEKAEVIANCDHLNKLKFTKALPFAFTEHGALMAASVLNSAEAVKVSVYIVRAFIQLREALATHKDLATKLTSLEEQMEILSYQHGAFAQNTRAQFKRVFDTLKQLMNDPEQQKRPIGFVTEE